MVHGWAVAGARDKQEFEFAGGAHPVGANDRAATASTAVMPSAPRAVAAKLRAVGEGREVTAAPARRIDEVLSRALPRAHALSASMDS